MAIVTLCAADDMDKEYAYADGEGDLWLWDGEWHYLRRPLKSDPDPEYDELHPADPGDSHGPFLRLGESATLALRRAAQEGNWWPHLWKQRK
ncbi:hypothetical protein GS896_25495 [Rhodococcus hoagii]|nr:hypothetical protein [Prescottella equi]MBM4654140.1 hypothetical protein [Prescottella equi]NKR23411.1 hypothetical protein [Prescottella equi]NKT55977.1 hypothetical protein [Prescottella equi]NKU37398.1 hypothetical protein [Prescottella equi]